MLKHFVVPYIRNWFSDFFLKTGLYFYSLVKICFWKAIFPNMWPLFASQFAHWHLFCDFFVQTLRIHITPALPEFAPWCYSMFCLFTCCQSCSVLLRSDDCAGKVSQSALLALSFDFRQAWQSFSACLRSCRKIKSLPHIVLGGFCTGPWIQMMFCHNKDYI